MQPAIAARYLLVTLSGVFSLERVFAFCAEANSWVLLGLAAIALCTHLLTVIAVDDNV